MTAGTLELIMAQGPSLIAVFLAWNVSMIKT